MRCIFSIYQQTRDGEIWLKGHLEQAYYVCGGNSLGVHGPIGSTGKVTQMYMDQRVHCQYRMKGLKLNI